MRKIVFIITVTIAIANIANAQSVTGLIENLNMYSKDKVDPNVYIQVNKYYANSRFGAFAYALAGEYYGEAVAGPTYTLKAKRSFAELAIGVGIETSSPKPLRYAGYVYAEHKRDTSDSNIGKISLLFNYEQSKSNYWYVGFAVYNITNRLAAGIHAQYNVACGPRLQISLPYGLFVSVAAGYSIETGQPGAATSLRLNL